MESKPRRPLLERILRYLIDRSGVRWVRHDKNDKDWDMMLREMRSTRGWAVSIKEINQLSKQVNENFAEIDGNARAMLALATSQWPPPSSSDPGTE